MKKLLLAVFCLVAGVCSAQTAQPIIQPYQHFVDGSGNPCAGCKLYSYAAGTNTPQATYTSSSESSLNPNPIVLDAAGGASIWIGSSAYKFELLNTYGTTLWTVDNVVAPAPGGNSTAYLPLAGGTMSGAINMGNNPVVNAQKFGIGTLAPNWSLDVENGAINTSAGYLYVGQAPLNHYLCGNGTYYVDCSTFPYSALSGTVPIWNQSTTGNAATATLAANATTANALAATPTQCTGSSFATGIAPNGNANCSSSTASDQYFTFAGCTAQNPYNGDAYCGSTTTLPTAFADTNYFLTCTASTTTTLPTGTSPGVSYTVVTQITSASGFTYGIGFVYSGGSPTAITPNITCHAHHN